MKKKKGSPHKNQTIGTKICLTCSAPPEACNESGAACAVSITKRLTPPACPFDRCLWLGLRAGNGGLAQAEEIALQVMRADDPRTYKWYIRSIDQLADRRKCLEDGRRLDKLATRQSASDSGAQGPAMVLCAGLDGG